MNHTTAQARAAQQQQTQQGQAANESGTPSKKKSPFDNSADFKDGLKSAAKAGCIVAAFVTPIVLVGVISSWLSASRS